jgi:hypothetical protein
LAPFSWGRRAGDEGLSGGKWHARRSGLPHERDFCGGEAVGLVDEVGESALEREGFGGFGAGRFDGAGAFVAEALEKSGEGIDGIETRRVALRQPRAKRSAALGDKNGTDVSPERAR